MTEDHIARMRVESQELLDKLNKLSEFRMGATHAQLTQHQRDLIATQATIMASYSQILRLRIALEEGLNAAAQSA